MVLRGGGEAGGRREMRVREAKGGEEAEAEWEGGGGKGGAGPCGFEEGLVAGEAVPDAALPRAVRNRPGPRPRPDTHTHTAREREQEQERQNGHDHNHAHQNHTKNKQNNTTRQSPLQLAHAPHAPMLPSQRSVGWRKHTRGQHRTCSTDLSHRELVVAAAQDRLRYQLRKRLRPPDPPTSVPDSA
eukprot:3470189-Rhodomonas_salina.2